MSLRSDGRIRRLPRWAIASAFFIVGLSAAVLWSELGKTRFGWYFDDLGALVVAGLAAAAAAWRAKTATGRARRPWVLLAIACASWCVGEALWSWFELGQGKNPFPSVADIGYLGFPLAAGFALSVFPAADGSAGRRRRVLDALLATGALALMSWETVMGAILHGGVDTSFTFAVSIAYPLTDFGLLVLVVLTLARARGRRLSLGLIAAGCAALAISDSLFAYLTAVSDYQGGAVDLGWIVAFVLIGLAALSSDAAPDEQVIAEEPEPAYATSSFFPYLPVVVCLVFTLGHAIAGHPPTTPQLSLATAIVALLLSRQYLTMRRNNDLAIELARREAQLTHQAFHDGLTGLANRALFHDRLSHALELHRRDLRAVAVLFIDLDDFKLVNDTLGHGLGDQLLSRVAERLVGAVRTGDTVARLGGDEFAVLVEDGGDSVTIAARIVDALNAPFALDAQQLDVRASVGVFDLDSTDVATTADQLLVNADTAMYAAKRDGKNRIALYQSGMALPEVVDAQLARALDRALRNRTVTLAYQPIVDLATGEIRVFEALARWRNDGQDISPAVFIPLAERTGLISKLTTHVLRMACGQLAEWSAALDRDDIAVAVNAPPSQIVQPSFLRTVANLLRQHRLAAGQLIIEITESGAFEDVAAARTAIEQLRAMGVRVSLDDFGVGNSSFSQLHMVDLDSVKIDKSFVDTLDSNPRQAHFLRALLRMSADLNLTVIVEGVERQQQLTQLLELGRPLAQGFLFSRPLQPAACLPLMTKQLAAATPRV